MSQQEGWKLHVCDCETSQILLFIANSQVTFCEIIIVFVGGGEKLQRMKWWLEE